jgi:iron complex outermembrane receptor protein
MHKMKIKKYALLALPLAIAAVNTTFAQELSVADDGGAINLEEIVVLGSRTAERTAADLPVPVDVISGKDFAMVGGGADITDNLNALVPSYLAAPATGDGSAFVRPTSLRGMASDQTLVLINGKRRHRSALVQLFAPAANNGSHGPDVAMIPTIAIRRVEVLRDGASSQYGSDAIAGVINFDLKKAPKGGSVDLTYGQHYEGESSWQFAANKGFNLADRGFVNVSFQTDENDALSRGVQRPNAQALIDAGVPGVGSDAQFGEAPLAQTWGRPETSGSRFVLNSAYNLTDSTELYFFGNYAKTEGTTRFFYRNPDHASLVGTFDDDGNRLTDGALSRGATNLERENLAGYTPYLEGDQTDVSMVLGVKGEFGSESVYDVSISRGSNELDYTLNNTLNGAAPLINGTNAQRNFDPGTYEQEEFNLTAELSTPITDTLYLVYGAEYRKEEFTQTAGEFASWTVEGSSGLAGIRPEDAGSNDRNNKTVYVDLEHEVNDKLFLQYAIRYEDFSDFGGTINGKVAGRYFIAKDVAIRGAVSTGFHAPTPGQANLRSTTTTFNNGQQVDVRLLPADDPAVAPLGGTALKEEEAVNYSFGFTSKLSKETTLTVDGYWVDVDDRIYRYENKVEGVSFYTNALDVEHKGIDVVLTTGHDWGDAYTNFILAYGYNKVSVVGNKRINNVQVVDDDTVEDVENNYPNHKWAATTTTDFTNGMGLMLRARYIGDHYDERGNIAGTSVDGKSQEIDPVVYVDLELSYKLTEDLSMAIGGSNIFDAYPNKLRNEPGKANLMNAGLPYPRRSVANYEGGSWYVNINYAF